MQTFPNQTARRSEFESTLFSADQLKSNFGLNFTYVSSQLGIQFLRYSNLLGRERAMFQALNTLAEQFRPFEFGVFKEMRFLRDSEFQIIPELRLILADHRFSFKYVGSGHFASVYSLRGEQGPTYALKIFYPRNCEDFSSGPWGETATGIYITENNVSNMPHLCLASPANGWILTEFVDAQYRSSCPAGPTWCDLGLQVYDSKLYEDNEISVTSNSTVRVDYGHMTTKENLSLYSQNELLETLKSLRAKSGQVPMEDFLRLYIDNPSFRTGLLFKLSCVSEESRLSCLKIMWTYPEAEYLYLQDYLTNGIIPYESTRQLFDMLMTHANPRVRAQGIFNIQKINEEDANYLGEQWYSRPEFLPFLIYLGEKSFREHPASRID